jgi:hypothetical protein
MLFLLISLLACLTFQINLLVILRTHLGVHQIQSPDDLVLLRYLLQGL